MFIDKNNIPSWDTNTDGFYRITGVSGLRYLDNEFPSKFYYKNYKNYQIVTGLTGSNPTGVLYIKYENPFKNIITKTTNVSEIGIEYYTYNIPLSTSYSKSIVSYGATPSFTSTIVYSNIREIDFIINGNSEFKYLNTISGSASQPNGWDYDGINYNWHYSNTSVYSPTYSVYGSTNSINYIARQMEYDIFNLEFNYNKTEGNIDDYTSMYISSSLDSSTWEKIITLTQSKSHKEFSLSGIDKNGMRNYLIFAASQSTSNFYGSLSDINIYGGYHESNNTLASFTTGVISPIYVTSSFATFSFLSVSNAGKDNSATSSLVSKFGNGLFKKGIWENGVWNNGWRNDENFRDFDDITQSIQTYSDITWRIKIKGSSQSTSFFNIGDKVSVGNIVAIDINDNRKLLKDYYRVIGMTYSMTEPSFTNYIEIEMNTTFPYRRIERDSDNHKIKVTKNIWLSGAFFNGYFSGVWNYGLFRGYPKITEMQDTYWIDGIYNGGKFSSNYGSSFDIIGLMPTDGCSVGNVTLTFLQHTFLVGDYIKLTFNQNYAYSNEYSSVVLVRKVIDSQSIIVDMLYISNTLIDPDSINTILIGNATRYTGTGLIQNFKFYDTNKSKLKSNSNLLSSSVFNFNSWINVNYDETRAVTLGKTFKSYDKLTKKSLSRNNLYGYPTYDILSSDSYFRDSFSLDTHTYRLGTKYKMYNDFIGDYSNFNDPFNDSDNFNIAGWTYSYNNESDITLLRTDSIISLNVYDLEVTQAYIESGVTGDELYTLGASAGSILNNNNIIMNNDRYSVVEFDVITHSNNSDYYIHRNSDYYTIESTPTSNGIPTVVAAPNEITSKYNISSTVPIEDIVEIEVGVDLIGDLTGIIINLISNNGSIINLKKKGIGSGIGFRLVDTLFNTNTAYKTVGDSISPYSISVTQPPYAGKYGMDKLIGQGTSYVSDTSSLSDLLGANISGDWTLYIWDDKSTVELEKWSLKFYYKNTIAINTRPDIDIPILNLSNLNYDISTQIVGTGTGQVYDKLSYLPITENIDHLETINTFRLDTIEDTSPENWNKKNNNKKYEYFYNKTDLMMNISGNGFMGTTTSMIILDNIKLYEVDMIPFFKYFNDSNIYKGIQIPLSATAPSIDYSKSDFIFLDNINIGIDSVESNILTNMVKCDIPLNAIIPPSSLTYHTPNTFTIGESVSLPPTYTGSTGTFSSTTLPLGLIISSTTGIISGSGVTQSVATEYIITLTNTEGFATCSIIITINDAPILPDNIIVANNDHYAAYNNVASDTNSVLTGDTLNGTQVVLFGGPYGVTLNQLSTTNITIFIKTTTGRIHIPSGTSVGSYTLKYEICEITNPTNCATASVVVSVSSAILPLLSFYFQGTWNNGDTLHHPEINSWVDYLDEYGDSFRFIVGGLENGCQEVLASSIVDYNGCDYCTPGGGSGGGGGGGCLIEGTLITLLDGTQTTIESLFINQQLLSSKIETLIDTNNVIELYKWSSDNLIESRINSSIVKVNPIKVYKTIIINNGLLEATPTHTQLIERDSKWRFVAFGDIVIGDRLYNINKEIIEITSLEVNTDERIVYPMLLSNISHTYFSNNILTHNLKQPMDNMI